jgi:hypothetical protein
MWLTPGLRPEDEQQRLFFLSDEGEAVRSAGGQTCSNTSLLKQMAFGAAPAASKAIVHYRAIEITPVNSNESVHALGWRPATGWGLQCTAY